MENGFLKARAELTGREWIEFNVALNSQGNVKSVDWHAQGCSRLLDAGRKLADALLNKSLNSFDWPVTEDPGLHHSTLLVQEIVSRLKGSHQLPYTDSEICHCRKVPTINVDQAIVLGAHTPDQVKAWTSASSQCGSCRPDVVKLLDYRLRRKA